MYRFTHVSATTVADAAATLAKGKAQVFAGGTDLMPYLKGMFTPNPPATIIDIKSIDGLDYIKVEGGTLKVGALTSLTDVANSKDIQNGWTALAQAAKAVAAPELRNMGTIGGNICQRPRCVYYRNEFNSFNCLRKNPSGICYALAGENRAHSIFGAVGGCVATCPSDTAPVLVAMGASIVTNKKTWSAVDFFVIPTDARREQINNLATDEIVLEIQVPALAAGTKSTYKKFAFRKAIDFPLVSCAAVVTQASGSVSKASIVLGGVYNTPKVSTEAQTSITGKAINSSNADAAGTAAVASAVALAKNKYKLQIAKVLIKQALLSVA
jgi:xanthine dehydrogenase YagS FAD-binding subunit